MSAAAPKKEGLWSISNTDNKKGGMALAMGTPYLITWSQASPRQFPKPLLPHICKNNPPLVSKATMRERRAQQPQGRPNPAVQFSSLAVCIYIWVTIQGAIKVGTNTSLSPGLVGRRKGHLHREGSTWSRGEELRVSEGPRKVCKGISGTGPGSQAQRTSKSS